MSKNELARLPREVAKAVEWLRVEGFSDYAVIGMLYSPQTCREIKAIQTLDSHMGQDKMHPDDLIKALVNGYEIEETPEDKVREMYEAHFDDGERSPYDTGYNEGVQFGVKQTLDILNIKISGVSAV